ncbi:biliverdin-producing heme oxygenase [Lewinella sp. IMCC34191]|uniref:biliverdin-producing heme oxygenase n=1 Tax=Lewinella sp. IMCC34191 TaxID=2259172 RepID=UPI000E26C8F9|nr:biliverdin-producing heme oxygenase [Lewinella sp. IMCC34191]
MKSPLLERLRGATREQHERLESVTLGNKIMDGSLTLPEYRRLQLWQERTHRVLEPLVAGFQYADYTYRPRFPTAASPDQTVTLPQALGILYVLEGSSLGGSIIYRKLRENSALTAGEPFSFYRNQADWGLQQWRSLAKVLDSVELSEAEMEEATRSAQDTFDRFTAEWAGLA